MSSSRSSPRNPAAFSSLYRGSERPPSWVRGSVPAVKPFSRGVRRLAGIPPRCTPGAYAGGGRQTPLSSFPGRLCREHDKMDAVYKERLCRTIRRPGGNTLPASLQGDTHTSLSGIPGVGHTFLSGNPVLVLYSRMLPGARALMGKGTGSGFFPWSGPWRLSPRIRVFSGIWQWTVQIRLRGGPGRGLRCSPPLPAFARRSPGGILTPILWQPPPLPRCALLPAPSRGQGQCLRYPVGIRARKRPSRRFPGGAGESKPGSGSSPGSRLAVDRGGYPHWGGPTGRGIIPPVSNP